jgi:Tol biopolymer transport system component
VRDLWHLLAPFLAVSASAAFTGASEIGRFIVLRQGVSDYESRLKGAVSADGRFVAFTSRRQMLAADSNVVDDIYVFDRPHGTLTLESGVPDGSPSNGASGNAQLSADGRYLVFESDATNLADTPDTNTSRDVFVRDRRTGATRRISVSAAGTEANDASSSPVISADGLVAAFVSNATNLTAGWDANGRQPDIYVVQVTRGEISRISVDSEGHQLSTGASFAPSLSADGRIVAFTSTTSSNRRMAGPSGPSRRAVFVRHLTSGNTTCLSCGIPGQAFDPHVSGDGRFVVFTSEAGAGRWSRRTDIVVYDRQSSDATVVTRRANASSAQPEISADGRVLVFQSDASNLECDRRCSTEAADENLLSDIYRFDRKLGLFRRVSGGPGSWWAPSVSPSVDARGLVVVFSSRQSVGPEDAGTDFDLFIWSVEKSSDQRLPDHRDSRAHLLGRSSPAIDYRAPGQSPPR